MTTDEDRLAEITKLAGEAPPGPWFWRSDFHLQEAAVGPYLEWVLKRVDPPVPGEGHVAGGGGRHHQEEDVDPTLKVVTHGYLIEELVSRPAWVFLAEARRMVADLLEMIRERDRIMSDLQQDAAAFTLGEQTERGHLLGLLKSEQMQYLTHSARAMQLQELIDAVEARGRARGTIPPDQAREENARFRRALEAIANYHADLPHEPFSAAVARKTLAPR